MKIAHLDTGREWRGGQAQVLMLLRGLRSSGQACVLLAPPGPLLDRAAQAGIEVAPWRAAGDLDLAAMSKAARLLRRFRPDLVHAHTARAHAASILPARWLGVPLVVSRRVAFGVGRNPMSLLKYRNGAERYLCVSRHVMEIMERAGIPRQRLALVPSGIDLAEIDAPAADLRELIGAPPGCALVGTVASLTREKGHGLLLEAASRLAARAHESSATAGRSMPGDVHFVWIGDGDLRAELEKERSRRGLTDQVHLLGFREDARALARQLTLLVSASSAEGLGNSILEAQAAGVPVIATTVGGVPDLIADGETGRLIPPGDAESLTRALIEALENPSLGERWAEAAKRSVRGFGSDHMVERTLEVYRDLLDSRGESARSG